MTRIILDAGAVIDTLCGGLSLFGDGESCWWLAICLGPLTVLAPLLLYSAYMVSESFDQPEVLLPPTSF